MSDETNAPNAAENSGSEQKRGRPFPKGASGNPGGRPKAVAELQEGLQRLTPKVLKTIEEAFVDPTPDEMKQLVADVGPGVAKAMLKAQAADRLEYIKLVLAYTLPKPKEADAFKEPMTPKAAATTTLGMFSEARALLSTELSRIRSVSDAGHPLTEGAAAKLTECVRQLAMLAEEEMKLLKADPFAALSDDELRQKLKEAKGHADA